ncbi:hypothetical protein ES703_114212 [subsurface metagenome]
MRMNPWRRRNLILDLEGFLCDLGMVNAFLFDQGEGRFVVSGRVREPSEGRRRRPFLM